MAVAGAVHDGGMAWGGAIGWLAGGLLAVATGVWVLVTRLTADQLSRADQMASVVGAAVALFGLPIAVYGLVLARRASASGGLATGSDVSQKVSAGGDAVVAGRDLALGRGYRLRGSGSVGDGKVRQDVHADQDAHVAARDAHIEDGREVR